MKTLGKYELLEEINAGGMGRIYRAHDRVLHRDVAIKTIYTVLTDPEAKQRFYREARACAALNHPNIVTIYDLGEQQGNSYISMELLEGEDLRRFVDRKGTMNLNAKVDFMIEVCEGLASAHGRGIIHRDIKPGNIFITRTGRPKILDFGVARIAASNLTQPGMALGTPKYMAPEQYLGRDCTPRSDLFSAAMVFFEFLVYTHPFEGPIGTPWTAADVPTRIMKEEPILLRAFNPDLPERLEIAISKALSKDPEERHPDAGELAKELRKVSLDIVRECARLWTQVLECRNRILGHEAKLGNLLQTARVREALQSVNLSLAAVDAIKPNVSTTAISQLEYSDLLKQHREIRRLEALLRGILAEASESGILKVLKRLSDIVSRDRVERKGRASELKK
jgi:serine/threonine protein kinase